MRITCEITGPVSLGRITDHAAGMQFQYWCEISRDDFTGRARSPIIYIKLLTSSAIL
jgi:hypothetical protein